MKFDTLKHTVQELLQLEIVENNNNKQKINVYSEILNLYTAFMLNSDYEPIINFGQILNLLVDMPKYNAFNFGVVLTDAEEHLLTLKLEEIYIKAYKESSITKVASNSTILTTTDLPLEVFIEEIREYLKLGV
jgi:hypothetical protein